MDKRETFRNLARSKHGIENSTQTITRQPGKSDGAMILSEVARVDPPNRWNFCTFFKLNSRYEDDSKAMQMFGERLECISKLIEARIAVVKKTIEDLSSQSEAILAELAGLNDLEPVVQNNIHDLNKMDLTRLFRDKSMYADCYRTLLGILQNLHHLKVSSDFFHLNKELRSTLELIPAKFSFDIKHDNNLEVATVFNDILEVLAQQISLPLSTNGLIQFEGMCDRSVIDVEDAITRYKERVCSAKSPSILH